MTDPSIRCLGLVLQTPGALPPLLWGPPGCGKTSRVRDLVRALGRECEVVISSIREPSDFSGLPVPENGHGVRLEPPAWAVRLCEHLGVLVLDEISCAPPAVQAALLRVVHERVVGDRVLPPEVGVVAIANPPDQAAGGWDMAAALANRFVHIPTPGPDAAEWGEWMTGTGTPDGEDVPRLDPQRFLAELPASAAFAAAFLRARPALLAEDPAKVAGRQPPAYATPRTWECAVRLQAAARATGTWDELGLDLLAGCLGSGVAVEYATWLREADLPNPEAVLLDPASWTPDPARPDRAYAVLMAVAGVATAPRPKGAGKADRNALWYRAWDVLERGLPCGQDVVTLAARALVRAKDRPTDGMVQVIGSKPWVSGLVRLVEVAEK